MITSINKPIDPADANISVSAPRQNGADVRQKAKPWEALGISRATWYRRGKPTERKPEPKVNLRTIKDQAKFFGASSTRSFQRMMRVLGSELAAFVHAGHLSIAQADRILGSPETLRFFRRLAEAEVAAALKLFEQERRNDVSAEAIAAYLNKPVAFVAEAKARALGDAP